MTEKEVWVKCMKKTESLVRDVRPDENGIETLEGYKPCTREDHFIMKGIEGEVYPIRKDIFYKTYEVTHGQ